MRNRTQHGLSWLTAISDAGSTPAASTSLRPLGDGSGSACQFSSQNRLSWLNAGEGCRAGALAKADYSPEGLTARRADDHGGARSATC